MLKQNLLRSRYFFFLITFIGLIILSNKYSQTTQVRTANNSAAINNEDSKDADFIYNSLNENYSDRQESNNKNKKLVAFATSLIGKKYTPAGKSPSEGFDCSGFTQYVFKKFRIVIPSSSITQSDAGEKVSLENAQTGDLIFFKSPTSGSNEIGHVGIVISNENNKLSFVHASTSRGVIIDNLDSKHYKLRYKTIRRINIFQDDKSASNQI